MDEVDLHYVISVNELAAGERVIVTIEGMEIAVFNLDEEFHAIANYCIHQSGPLAEGTLTGSISCTMTEDDWELVYDDEERFVACPWHGWMFDVTTGIQDAASGFSVPTYETVVRDSKVYVRL